MAEEESTLAPPRPPVLGGGGPWWQSGLVVTVLGALAAAVAPVTVAIQENIRKQQELALAEKDQYYKMRMAYLDLAVDPARSPADRRVVLRFLKAVIKDDDALASWADSELKEVDQQLVDLNEELKKKTAELEAKSKAEAEARAQLDELRRTKEASDKKMQNAEDALAHASAEKAVVEERTQRIQSAIKPSYVSEGMAAPPQAASARLSAPAAAQGATGACEPGTVRAIPTLRVPQEMARIACEGTVQQATSAKRALGRLAWQTQVSLSGRDKMVSCECKPASP